MMIGWCPRTWWLMVVVAATLPILRRHKRVEGEGGEAEPTVQWASAEHVGREGTSSNPVPEVSFGAPSG